VPYLVLLMNGRAEHNACPHVCDEPSPGHAFLWKLHRPLSAVHEIRGQRRFRFFVLSCFRVFVVGCAVASGRDSRGLINSLEQALDS